MGGNRKPVVAVSAEKKGGTVPFEAVLSSRGTKDFDNDALKYNWKVTSPGIAPKVFTTENPKVKFDKPGVYTATLTVTDSKGASNSRSVRIIAGNEPPKVAIELDGNSTFFFPNKPVGYAVGVSDKEDGTTADGKIKASQVAVSIDYTAEGFDYAEVAQSQRSVDATTQFAVAQVLMSKSDCKVCHQPNTKSVGPSFADISNKYRADPGALDKLVKKVREGGSGVWGEVAMAAHPALPVADVEVIVKYILNSTEKTLSTLPLKGKYTPQIPKADNGKGSVIIRAAYTDRPVGIARPVPAQTTEEMIVLRSPELNAAEAPITKGVETKALGVAGQGFAVVAFGNSYIAFPSIDLTGIDSVELNAAAQQREGSVGGTIEIRLGSPDGILIGQQKLSVAKPVDVTKMMAELENGAKKEAAGPGSAPAAQTAKPAPRSRFAQPAVRIALQPASGKQDVYFVFRNMEAKPIEPLMSFSRIKFKNKP
ncbi:PKD domain-containing protein [Dyadobacter sp. 676]|uniref:PKD domain-containing protein n=1 Tax=Dyadobacter sp. 676 TaxID=3088362 RepID=A0AAU8FJB1_9BACT